MTWSECSLDLRTCWHIQTLNVTSHTIRVITICSSQSLDQKIDFHHSGSCLISGLFPQKTVAYLV